MAHESDTWLWERARLILDQAEGLERRILQRGRSGGGRVSWVPPVDVFETADEVWVLVALPGVDPAGVEVLVDGRRVAVVGARALPGEVRKAAVHRLEIPSGRFERILELPEGRYESVSREMRHGCLAVRLRKVEE